MKLLSVEGLAGQTGLSVRSVFRYLRALNIRPAAIQDGRNHYAAIVARTVTDAALASRNARADAIRASIRSRKAADAAAPPILTVAQIRAKAARKGGGR